jgi:S1-C subfamily serine protease
LHFSYFEGNKPLEVTVLRMQQELTFQVETVSLSGTGTEKIVMWAGGHFQNTHRAVDQLGFSPEGVYCSRWHYGSPSHKYGLRATFWVVEINGVPTPDLESFIAVIKDIEEDVFVRLKLVGLQDKAIVITMKLDLTYFPTAIIHREKDGTWIYSKLLTNKNKN